MPDIELANNYPTIGPNGEEYMNINGRACSIELFLGKDVLSEDGKYIPVPLTRNAVEKTKAKNEQENLYEVQFYQQRRFNYFRTGFV